MSVILKNECQTETSGISLIHSSLWLDLFSHTVTVDQALNLKIQGANVSVNCIGGANADILCLFLADGSHPEIVGCCSAHP